MAECVFGPRREPPPGFGAALKEQRLACGLSQSKLASAARISVDFVRQLEQGKRHPSPATLDKLTKALEPPSGLVPLKEKRFKRHRRWRPECPRCRTNAFVVKLPGGMFCQNPASGCFWFLPPEVMKRPSSTAAARFPMVTAR